VMLKYLLDTNILSEAKRPQPNQKVMEHLRLYKREIATASLVIHELFYGCFRLPESKKRKDLEYYQQFRVYQSPTLINQHPLPPLSKRQTPPLSPCCMTLYKSGGEHNPMQIVS